MTRIVLVVSQKTGVGHRMLRYEVVLVARIERFAHGTYLYVRGEFDFAGNERRVELREGRRFVRECGKPALDHSEAVEHEVVRGDTQLVVPLGTSYIIGHYGTLAQLQALGFSARTAFV